MYSTCLFCHNALGRNEAIEDFPVGRRLAFDAAKGRLWVVCRKCERWNLSPLEERWEAIEECERAFRETKLRVSTDQIGLAKLKEGLELVRIGAPQRPEMAAWRYGDQFGRRRKRYMAIAGAGVVVAGGILIAGPMMGIVGAGALSPMVNLLNAGGSIYRSRVMVHVPTPSGSVRVRLMHVPKTKLFVDGDSVMLRIQAVDDTSRHFVQSSRKRDMELTGDDAIRAAAALLPRMNSGGGSAKDVSRAVDYLEESGDARTLFRRAVDTIEKRERNEFVVRSGNLLKNLPAAGRLALEMATHEESERRALEGELHVLEAAWKDAEEIAGIADDMFLPAGMDDELARLKRRREEG
ncbi:MAG: hypothetical protein ABIY52_14015 [Gemmatimonadaceae bacterium]